MLHEAMSERWEEFERDVRMGLYDVHCRRIARHLIEAGYVRVTRN